MTAELRLLSTEEQAQAQRYVLPHLRRRYAAAHSAMRRILAQYASSDPRQLIIAKESYGKPYLPQMPNLAFNLTHSENLALLAVFPNKEAGSQISLGIDLEFYRCSPTFSKISARWFTTAERTALPLPLSPHFPEEFLRQWTRKEAVTKCLGTGLRTPLSSFSALLSSRPEQIQWHIQPEPAQLFVQDINLALLRTGQPYAAPTYIASLCSSAGALEYQLKRYSWAEA